MVADPNTCSRTSLYPWYAVGVLMLAFVLSFADRQILGLLLTPVRRDLGLDDARMSLLLGPAFAVPFILAGLPLARLADRYNRRNLIAVGVLVWSAATLLCAFARSFHELLLARALIGIGEAALAPAAYSLIVDCFARERRATALSVFGLGIYLGVGLAFMLGGAVIAYASQPGAVLPGAFEAMRPWQLVFVTLGVGGMLLAPLLLTIREPARGARYAAVPLPQVFAYLRQHARAILLHNLGFAMLAMSSYASVAWLPTFFVRSHGWSASQFGLVYGGIVTLFGGSGVLFGGWLADRWMRRGQVDAGMRVGCVAAFAGLVFGLLYLLPVHATLAAALIIPAAFLAGMPVGVSPAALQELVPANLRAQASALSLLIVNVVGLGFGPVAVALCTQYVFRDESALGSSLLIVCGGAQLIAALLLCGGLAPYRESLARQQATSASQA